MGGLVYCRRTTPTTMRSSCSAGRKTFGDGTASSYAIGADGGIELREAVAAQTVEGEPGLRDEALSSDGRYLYALHSDAGRVFGWKVGEDGSLAAVGSANGLPLTAAGLAAT